MVRYESRFSGSRGVLHRREFFRQPGEILPGRVRGFNESVAGPRQLNLHHRALVKGNPTSKAVPRSVPGRRVEGNLRRPLRRKSNAAMVSDATVQRYYYIYDSRELRTLVMDRVTGEEFAWTDDVRTPLLRHVAGHDPSPEAPEGSLRRFALWCARESSVDPSEHDDLGPSARDSSSPGPSTPASGLSATRLRLLDAAAAWIEGGGDAPEAARRETADDTVHAATVGLAQMDPQAASMLTAQACTHPDAWRAALDAAHMSERCAEFEAAALRRASAAPHRGARSRGAQVRNATTPSPDAAAHDMRLRQIDHLLDLLHG